MSGSNVNNKLSFYDGYNQGNIIRVSQSDVPTYSRAGDSLVNLRPNAFSLCKQTLYKIYSSIINWHC